MAGPRRRAPGLAASRAHEQALGGSDTALLLPPSAPPQGRRQRRPLPLAPSPPPVPTCRLPASLPNHRHALLCTPRERERD
uniref:Uncharacterized protein n=1 Tax=Oryza sativa subsp. japonica TaxID=39947 RepID=Q8LH76_ORYSJ|nr:hypothetical protein [Oryza sativa Japonica Group]BAC16107.1 hypothetical protein [Oryza sativa Japonica Group]